MTIKSYVLGNYSKTDEWFKIVAVSDEIHEFISKNQLEFNNANQPENSSNKIEHILKPKLLELGFTHEPKKEYKDAALRPDFVHSNMGIILEVERGKILNNNMDMLDLWKTHIHEKYHYLVLIVPNHLKHNSRGRPEFAFTKVSKRLSKFFTPENKTNVRGLIILGY